VEAYDAREAASRERGREVERAKERPRRAAEENGTAK